MLICLGTRLLKLSSNSDLGISIFSGGLIVSSTILPIIYPSMGMAQIDVAISVFD